MVVRRNLHGLHHRTDQAIQGGDFWSGRGGIHKPVRARSISEGLFHRARLPVAKTSFVDQAGVVLSGARHHDAGNVHGREYRLERADPWWGTDVPGAEIFGTRYRTGCVSGGVSRVYHALPYRGSAETLSRLVRPLCEG